MQVEVGTVMEVGSIVEGRVTGITNFGAFVEMTGGKTGMVHISEVSNSYVKEIGDFISENQEVKVKIMSIADDGKISLSMKRCEEPSGTESEPRPRPQQPPKRRPAPPRNMGWQPKPAESADDMSFEDMMAKFKQNSNDRMSDLKKASEPKRSRRNSSK